MKASGRRRGVSILLRLWLNCVVYFERENYINIWRFGAKNLCLSSWSTLLKLSSFTSHGVFSNTGQSSSWVNTLLCLNTRRKHRKIPSLTEHTFHGLMSLFLHVLSAIFKPWFKGKFLLLAFVRHFIILIAENSTFYICVFMSQSLSEYNNVSLITTWISTVTFFRSCVQRSSIISISKMFCHIHLNVLDH